jgi:3-deoxy-manno-octulosonate cytidylyltransferase (CMP-KDO synthetase)
METKNILILIPARYDSTRFPGKPLAKILGKPMIQWVYERAIRSFDPSIKVIACVVTDSDKVKSVVDGFGGKVCIVNDHTESGTERIAFALERFFKNDHFDLVINVQGDEPLIESEIIEELANFHLESNFDIATVVRKEKDIGQEPNTVKAIYCPSNGQCLYFSRSEVPFDRNNLRENFYAHVGIYSFRPSALKAFCTFPLSHYEKIESLEQLRALENGLTIGAIEVNVRLQGVDTPSDISKVEEKLNE